MADYRSPFKSRLILGMDPNAIQILYTSLFLWYNAHRDS
jgi:hypothetical protein